jgi:hypothetical protein
MNKQTIYENKDASIPCQLKTTQEWFAGIITSRLTEDNLINSHAPTGMLIAEEAARYIVPSPTLRPHQRMQIYNQQYWWRLLNTLHDNFPLVTRLFGHHAFNEEIGIPYLMRYPPNHWSLSSLGERLPKWVTEEYQAPDRPLILNAAQLDWAFTESFLSPQKASLDLANLIQDNPDNLLAYTFYLQPHIQLFKWDYDLISFREAFLKEKVDYWTENDFPPLLKERTYYFILYRSLKNNILGKEISSGEYALLSILKKGSTIESACEFLEQQETSIYEQAVTNLQQWFQDWTIRQWLTLEDPKNSKT